MRDDFITILFLIIFISGTIGFVYITNKIACSSKANALGYKSNYAFFQGCVLEKPNGKKVLLQQLRDFEN